MSQTSWDSVWVARSWEGACREQVFQESECSKRSFLAFSDLVSEVIQHHFHHPNQRGKEIAPALDGRVASSHWRRACWMGDIMGQLDGLWNIPAAMCWLQQQSLLWIQAILQSRCPPIGLASPYQLMIPQPLPQGKSSMDNHTPALRDHHLEGTEVMSTPISWFSQPCLNSGEQASVALWCAQKEKS